MQDQPRPPHEKINFNLRPAKRIERKLVAEALTCIYRYDTPRRYGYVGMGSYYFSDFVLFHRLFGLEQMISIEMDRANENRFSFNKPYDCIDMAWGTTTDHLPSLSIFKERPVICWLDYYSMLTDSVIGDVQTVLRRALPGSALLVTLNSRGLDSKKRLQQFEHELSEDARRLSNKELLKNGPRGLTQFVSEVLTASIESTVSDLNAGRKDDEKLEVRQIVYMFYQDGDPMVTMGWLLLNPKQASKLDDSPSVLDAPGIALHGGGLVEVRAPVLTFREIAHLKSILPNGSAAHDFEQKAGAVPIDDARLFARLYRYFPSFADIEE